MPAYYIYMSQGLAGDLRNYSLCSGQFSSCAPIVFYNDQTHIGGLYHLGGCSELSEMKIGHLQQMATIVDPTDVYVLCGGGQSKAPQFTEDEIEASFAAGRGYPVRQVNRHGYYGLSGHVAPVRALLAAEGRTVHTDFGGLTYFTSVTVSVAGGGLSIADGNPFDKTTLNTKAKIDALPGALTFLGEDDDEALSGWI